MISSVTFNPNKQTLRLFGWTERMWAIVAGRLLPETCTHEDAFLLQKQWRAMDLPDPSKLLFSTATKDKEWAGELFGLPIPEFVTNPQPEDEP